MTDCTDNAFVIIYVITVPLFLAGIMEIVSEKLLLISSVTIWYKYIQFEVDSTICCNFVKLHLFEGQYRILMESVLRQQLTLLYTRAYQKVSGLS